MVQYTTCRFHSHPTQGELVADKSRREDNGRDEKKVLAQKTEKEIIEREKEEIKEKRKGNFQREIRFNR